MGSCKVVQRFGLILLLIMLLGPLSLSAQSRVRHPPQTPQAGQQDQPEDSFPKDMRDRMAKEQLKHRYDSLKRDSEKLLELATELKQYVDKSDENVMSLEVIKKCDEIEKLSKSVRTKMKGD